MLNTAVTDEASATADDVAPRRRRARVPNSHLGRISGRGKATVHATQLLFWRAYRTNSRSDFVLTSAEAMKEPHVGGLGMSKRAFTAGIKILTESGVIERWQPKRRAPVQEALAPAMKGEGYVELDPQLILYGPAKLVAFTAMVLLNPKPVHPRHVALGYLDLRHHKTVNNLVQQALDGGYIAGAKIGGRWIVCRPEKAASLVKNGDTGLVKNGDAKPVKNGDASIEELADGKRTASAPKESLGTNLGSSSIPSDFAVGSSERAEVRENGSEDDAEVLRQADRAGALARYLLTPGAMHGYRALVAEYGDVARMAITATLARLAIDGAQKAMITSWEYFRGAVVDELKLTYLTERSIRPGDTFNWHRKLDIDGRNWRGQATPPRRCDELFPEEE